MRNKRLVDFVQDMVLVLLALSEPSVLPVPPALSGLLVPPALLVLLDLPDPSAPPVPRPPCPRTPS